MLIHRNLLINDSTNLKLEIDKLDIDELEKLNVDKLKPVSTVLSKLSDVVKTDKLVKKVNAVDTSKLVNKTDYNDKIKDIVDKTPNIINWAPTAAFNAKVKEVQGKIPSIAGLATTTALTAVENKIPNVSDLVEKADYDHEIKEIKSKYLIASDYNKITNNVLDTKITEKTLVNESCLNDKIKTLTTKEEKNH